MTRSPDPAGTPAADPFAGGGEMGRLMAGFDWSATPLGPPAGWPQSLRTAVSICLGSRFPIVLWWGPDLRLLYNDAWRPALGTVKHPALAKPGREVWAEIWHIIGPMLEGVYAAGRATWSDDMLLPMDRYGFLEETYWTYSYSPIRDDAAGRVGGVFTAVQETTLRVVGERRLRTLRELAAQTATESRSAEEACRAAAAVLAANPADLPFALVYLLDPDGRAARLVGAAGVAPGAAAAPEVVLPADDDTVWPLGRVARTRAADFVSDRLPPLPGGAWPEPPRRVAVLPVPAPGQDRVAGFLVAGVSPRRPLDDDYRGFLDLVAGHVGTAVASARAFEEEKRRAEALAAIDRAKTAFFSNVSHEFRTPLTLMLGPVEDLLAGPDGGLSAAGREQLALVRRNGRRLQKLVNTLLDFSRIEAGRARAVYAPTDLAALTADLASNFRSAAEKAGLRFVVDCPPLPGPVHVDRDMWEKVVLNLLSNALKFTFAGEIRVTVRADGGRAVLAVADTGAGIPAAELPRLFDRFHRVEGSRGRTHEGTGIGLALVRELVHLHGGAVGVDSEEGRGTTFTVAVPFGAAHLPADQVADAAPASGGDTAAFVEEVLGWLPSELGMRNAECGMEDRPGSSDSAFRIPHSALPRVLLADDNADMRGYVRRLLAGRYAVEAVADGAAALEAAKARRPDLVLTDVMMPRLDGFGLLAALRADPALADLPVILVSARAGEEARVEGLRAGADDYLVKPFSAGELLARVDGLVALAAARREAAEGQVRFRELADAMPQIVYVTGPGGGIEFVNRQWAGYTGQAGAAAADLPAVVHPDDLAGLTAAWGVAVAAGTALEHEFRLRRADGAYRWFLTRSVPIRDGAGAVARWYGTSTDIHDRKRAEDARRASEARFRELCEAAPVAIALSRAGTHLYVNRAFLALVGLPPGTDLVGRSALDHVAPRDRAMVADRIRRRAAGEPVPAAYEYTGLRADGSEFVAAIQVGPLVLPDGPASVSFTLDITDRKRAEAAVRASEERFRLAAEAVNGIIYEFDPGTGTVERTRGLAEVLGFGPDEAPATADWWWGRVHPDDRPRVVDGIDLAAAPGRLVTEYRVRHRDGRWLHVEDRAVVLRDPAGVPLRLVGCTVDVTARKEAEEAARSSRARLDFVLRSAGVGLWLNPLPFGKMNWDERVKAHFHLPPDSDPDIDDFWARLHPDDRGPIRRAVEDALAGRADYDVDYRTVDPAGGAVRWVRAIGKPTFAPDGTPVRFDGITLDVTDRKRAEEVLREADRRKDEFLALLAHELRNPLAPLRNSLQIVRLAPPDSPAAAHARAVMDRQLAHMVRLIDDLLDVSRITRDKMVLRKAPTTLAEVVAAAVESAGPVVEAAGHTLTVSLPPDPVRLDADQTRLAQVFANLLTNSAKYTPRGGHVRLAAELGTRGAEPGAEGPAGRSGFRPPGAAFVTVTVRDDGIGIPAEFLPRLFDMFSQVDRSVEKATGGLGIGLALVKGLTEMHGGTVAADSPGPGKGSTFTVRLPVARSAELGVRSENELPADPTPSSLRTPNSALRTRKRVLVVDDNRDAAESMAEMLRLLGNEVAVAHDGLDAVEAAGRVRPDLILMDVGMPRLNGLDATRRIREQPWGGGMTILALTGWGQDDDRERSRAAGCDGHLVKPATLADLDAAVARPRGDGRNGEA